MKIQQTVPSIFLMASIACLNKVNVALADSLSPEATYLKYRNALASAHKIDELTSFMCKKVNDEIKNTPADMEPMMFGLMKETAPKKVKVLAEEIKGDSATLTLTSFGDAGSGKNSSETSNGSVTFVKENGDWKLNKETWNIKVEVK